MKNPRWVQAAFVLRNFPKETQVSLYAEDAGIGAHTQHEEQLSPTWRANILHRDF